MDSNTPTPFTDIQPSEQAPTPFTDILDQAGNPPVTNPYSEKQTTQTAALGALSQQRLNMVDPGTGQGRLQQLISINEDTINSGNEKHLRNQIAQASKDNNIARIQNLQSDLVTGTSDNIGLSLTDLVHHEMNIRGTPTDPNALEKEGVTQLQNMGATDPDQAALLTAKAHEGDFLQGAADNVTKLQIFNREYDVFKKQQADEGIVSKVGDFIGSLIIPSAFFKEGNNPNETVSHFFDLPGNVEQKEIKDLWSLPVDQFAKAVPQVFDRLHDKGTMGSSVAQDYAKGGLNNSDKLDFNVGTGLQLLSFIPISAALKVGSVPSKMARVLGNRTASAEIVSSQIAKDMSGVTGDPVLANTQSPAHSIEESLPSSLITGPRPDVGITGDVADKITKIQNTTQAVQKVLSTADRFAGPAQLNEAIDKALAQVQETYNDGPRVVDMKTATFVPDTEPGEFPKTPYTPKYSELHNEETDLDNLSYINARGEMYNSPAGVPKNMAIEHQAEVQRIETEATQLATKQYNESGEIGGIRAIPALSRNSDTGVYSLNMYLGKKYTSGGFITRQGAEAAATRMGFDLDSIEIHQNSDGQWFPKIKQNVLETGIATPVLKDADFKGVFKVSQYLKNLDNIQPDIFNQTRSTMTLEKSKFMTQIVKPWADNIRGLSKSSTKAVAAVTERGRLRGNGEEPKWYTQQEFQDHFYDVAGRYPTEKETLAYYSGKELNDINYHIFNNEMYVQKFRRGLQTVSVKNDLHGLDTGKVNGRIINNPDFDQMRVLDSEEFAHIPAGSDTANLNRKMATGRYRVVELEKEFQRAAGDDPAKHILAPIQDTTLGPLSQDQLGYVEGGNVEYRGKWFSKQANIGNFQDGNKYWSRPITHVVGTTRKQIAAWTDAMEEARLAYRDPNMSELEKRRIIDRSPAETFDKFDRLVKDGKINPDMPFETVFDKQQPTAMTKMGDKDAKWIEPDESPYEGYNISRGRMYYSKKGEEQLKDPQGNYAETIDPNTTLNRAIQNAAQTRAFGDYNRQVMDEWSRVATPYLDKVSYGNNTDSANLFFNGKFQRDFDKGDTHILHNQLEMMRNTHLRFMGMQSPEQRWTYTAALKFSNWIESKGKWGEWLAAKSLDRMSSNPVTAAKGMVYDKDLGMFNPARLWVHTQTGIQAMAIDPIYGARSAGMLLPTTHLMLNRSENLLDYYATRLKMIHGMEPDQYKQMIRSLRNSGWLNVSGEQVNLDNYMNALGGSALGKGVETFRETGRMFQNLSERFNRVTAYQMAYKKVLDSNPKMQLDSSEFLGRVNNQANQYTMNMLNSSAAFWQRGPLSVPTQFHGYQMHVLENVLPKSFGGSPSFSGAQKLRLAMFQTLMYGASGAGTVELSEWAADQYQKATGSPMTQDLYRTFSKGIFDSALHATSGGRLDTDASSKLALGSDLGNIYDDLTGGNMNSVLSTMSGASGEAAGGIIGTLGQIVDYMRAEQVTNLNPEQFKLMAGDLASNVSSLNHIQKSYWVLKAGSLQDPKTGEKIADEPTISAIATTLGIPLREETERWQLIKDNKNFEQDAQAYGKMLANVRRQAFTAMSEGDIQKADNYNKIASGIMMIHRDDPFMERAIAKYATKELGYTGEQWQALQDKTLNLTGKTPYGGK